MTISPENWLFAVVIGFCVTLIAQAILSQLSYRWQLLDKPGAHRNHDRETPLVGGISVYLGLLAALICTPLQVSITLPLILGSGLVVITGTLDDLFDLPSRYRFLSQVLAATLVCGWGDVRLLELGVLWPGGESVLTGQASLGISIFAMVGLMNATNMSDGIDGQCGVLAVLALGSLLIIAAVSGQVSLAVLTSLLFATSLAFLLFNIKVPWRARAHLFLGDAGSMLLGFLLAWSFIAFSQVTPVSESVTMQPVTALWLVALPLFDTLAVMLRRLLERQSPFRADRSHYHHLLRAAGLSAGQTTAIIAGFAASFAAIGICVERYLFQFDAAKTGTVMLVLLVGFLLYFAAISRAYWRLRASLNPDVLVAPSVAIEPGHVGDNIRVLRPRVVAQKLQDATQSVN